MTYECFHRTWWRANPDWPDGREPGAGERFFVAIADTEAEARQICNEWNASHDPGLLDDMCEYEKI